LSLLKDLWVGRNHGREAEYKGPKLHKYPLDKTNAEMHLLPSNKLPEIEKTLHDSKELYTAAPDGSVFHDLYDGQVFNKFVVVDKEETTTTTKLSLTLEVLHTPGHSTDSICIYLPIDQALYTADTLLGHGTAVFEDLAAYISSLNKLLRFSNEKNRLQLEGQGEAAASIIIYPGHGDVLRNGPEMIATYIEHRLEREAQILEVLQLPVPLKLQSDTPAADRQQQEQERQEQWTTWNLVRHIYRSYPENLWLPATRSLFLHLKKLEGEGFVRCVGGEGKDMMWELVAPIPEGSTTS
jgi:ribonuclease/clavin/mitogillin